MQIAVALSGGIDSSAACWLLKQQGWEVTGFTMHHFSDEEMGFAADSGINAVISQAAKVCEFLKIPHRIIDVKQEFKNTVIRNFIHEYASARTPNPCTLCNRIIKWGSFMQAIEATGIDIMATGHYIRRQEHNGHFHLFRSEDQRKDQSYMLWQLSQPQLAKTLFPLADLSKAEAKQIIIDNGIPVSIHRESQEVCFINGHYEDFLRRQLELREGDIVLADGKVAGRHYGLPLYTIGQRKGLHTNLNVPLYVKKLDKENNRLIVTTDVNELRKKEFLVSQLNWIADSPLEHYQIMVQIRYNSPPLEVEKLVCQNDSLLVVLKKTAKSITPGQSAVFYRNDELIGGGIIL